MTTFQEPPLQSRRAARQVERASVYGQRPDPEPLTYATQNRPPLPHYDTADVPSRDVEGEPATQVLPRQDVPSYRPRDFSPEGRRAHHAVGQEPPALDDGRIEYRTQNRTAVPVVTPPPVAEPPTGEAPAGTPPAAEAPRTGSVPLEHTMTRRELRALREAQGADLMLEDVMGVPTPAPTPIAAAPAVPAPAASPVEHTPAEQAPAEPTPAFGEEASDPVELSPFDALFLPPSESRAVQAPEPVALVEPGAATAFVLAEPAPVAEPAPEAAAPVSSPPAGHWTTQSDLDDATQANETTFSRRVGAGSAITTSALVLPSIPSTDYTHLGTGEVLVTGSIDLPHSLATSGAHPAQLDEHHLDHELDPGDHQVVSTDSQPVRATKAISTHTSTRNVIVTKKSGGNRGLTALIISAAAMAAVVVTLLVVGLVAGVL